MFISGGGCWTHKKCRFTIHKTIYSLQHQKSLKHSRAFQPPVSCVKLLIASFLFAYVHCLMHTTTVSFVRQDSLSKFTLHLCFRSTVCLSFASITFAPIRHKGGERKHRRAKLLSKYVINWNIQLTVSH